MASSSSYGTRSTLSTHPDPRQAVPILITSSSPAVPSPLAATAAASSLSSSVGKRKPSSSTSARRRLSQSSVGVRVQGIALSHSMPVARAGGSLGELGMDDGEDDGEVKGKDKKGPGVFECEKCRKVYRHSTCLVKHRWEHTAHWKEASKLLLTSSKHQQVQLLEAAAILKAAASGSSLPDQKDYWPAAVSPPSSGLLGSHSLNINVLTSPRLFSHSLLSESSFGPEPSSSVLDEEEEDDEEDTSEDVSTAGTGTGDELVGEMFEMELDGGEGQEDRKSKGVQSGYGMLGLSVSGGAPALGFFPGRNSMEIVS